MNVDEMPLIFLLGFAVESAVPSTMEEAKIIGRDVEEAGSWDYKVYSIGVFRGDCEDHIHLNVVIQFTLKGGISSASIRKFAEKFKKLLTRKGRPGSKMIYIQTLSPEEVESMRPEEQNSRVVH